MGIFVTGYNCPEIDPKVCNKENGVMKISYPILLAVLVFISLLSIPAFAEDPDFLPYSSHYQGRTYFEQDGYKGHIDFAVYDTTLNENDGITNPGSGQYLYAYQLFFDYDSADSIEYFSLLGIGFHEPGDLVQGSETDGIGDIYPTLGEGQAPVDEDFHPEGDNLYSQAWWQFDNGQLIGGERSYLLLLSTDHNYKTEGAGFSFTRPDGSIVVPNPEPATLGLLALGGLLLRKRRN